MSFFVIADDETPSDVGTARHLVCRPALGASEPRRWPRRATAAQPRNETFTLQALQPTADPRHMTTPLRPNLGTILPKPWVHRLAANEPQYRAAMHTPNPATEDYLVEVGPAPSASDAGEPGFGLGQATTVAARVARWFREAPGGKVLQRPDAQRTAGLLAGYKGAAARSSWLAEAPAAAVRRTATSPPHGSTSPS